jgi:hypothetical protein
MYRNMFIYAFIKVKFRLLGVCVNMDGNLNRATNFSESFSCGI